MTVDIAPIAATRAHWTCGSSVTGMAGVTECELEVGHVGLHRGRRWGDPESGLATWKIGGRSGCLPPFFTPTPGESEAEAEPLDWPVRLEHGGLSRLHGPAPVGSYRCRRIGCWQLQSRDGLTVCPTCAAPICARCSRCGGPWAHVPSGELAYASDRSAVTARRVWIEPDAPGDQP